MPSSFTRRELLAGLLGASAAGTLGSCRLAGRLPEGRFVGASHGVGHRLRDGWRPRPADDGWQNTGVVIVGGGIAGLAAAWRLERTGYHNFVLLELESAPGGTARSGSSDLIAYPWGAHYLPVPLKENAALVELLEEMDVLEGRGRDGEPVVREQFLCRDPEERLFHGGRWHEGLYPQAGASRDELAQLKRFEDEIARWVGWRDEEGRRAFTLPMAECSADPVVAGLDRLTMADWLNQHGFTSPRLRWLIDYACRDDYGLTARQASAWAGLFYFASRIRRPGERPQPLMTWPAGNGRLASYLYEQVRPHVRLGRAVTEIVARPEGDRLDPRVETRTPRERSTTKQSTPGVDVVAVGHWGEPVEGWRAERVIFTAPQFLATHLIAGYREARGAATDEFQYGSWMVANLHLRDRPRENGFPLAWDNVLYDSPSLGYVVATHQRGLDYGPTVFTHYHALCDDDSHRARQTLLELSWEECAEFALSDLEAAHPDLRDLTERLDVMRWGHAMIAPRPGFVTGPARREAARPFGPIHFANTDLSGIALFEEAFYHGLRAADEVLDW